jgi:hypothetical protein
MCKGKAYQRHKQQVPGSCYGVYILDSSVPEFLAYTHSAIAFSFTKIYFKLTLVLFSAADYVHTNILIVVVIVRSSSSSSSLARQHYVGPGLPQKLLPAEVSGYYFRFRHKSPFQVEVSPTPSPRLSWRAYVFCQGCPPYLTSPNFKA